MRQLETLNTYKLTRNEITSFFKTKKIHDSPGVFKLMNFSNENFNFQVSGLLYAKNVVYLANKKIVNYSNDLFKFSFPYYGLIILPEGIDTNLSWMKKLRTKEVKSSALLSEIKDNYYFIDLGTSSIEEKKSNIEFERDVYALLSRILL